MNKSAANSAGLTGSEVLEEAVRLLRRAPLSILITYFIGAIPCLLGALYFFADLSGSADAAARVLPASIGLTVLWFWMKCWHAVFAARLRSEVLLDEPLRWTPARLARLALAQIALQPTGFILRPLAATLLVPHAWTANFYQNLTVLGDGSPASLRELGERAFVQCRLWTAQAHVILVMLFVFGLFVWLNLIVAMLAVPFLLKMLLGAETMFTQHLTGMFNPTFFAASFAGAYLCLDPIRKAAFVLRCFYGCSRESGADLEVQLRAIRRQASPTKVLALFLLFAAALPLAPARAALQAEPQVQPSELNRSLDEVLERREFAWRSPRDRQKLPGASDSWWAKFKKDLDVWVERTLWKIGRGVKRILDKIDKWFSRENSDEKGRGDWLSMLGSVRVLFYVLLAIAAILLVVLLARFRRRPRPQVATAQPATTLPDLREENVTADQLPEDGWLQLARDLMQSGELRLALRASYLAGLAHLGHRELIRLARHKSNRDYDAELRRRARAQPELTTAFEHNLAAFERAWYGEHAVTPEALDAFTQRLEKIRAC